jgi:hypothetical protein
MNKLDSISIAHRKLGMRVRAALRLKAQEQFLDDLNECLPDLEKNFWRRVQLGKLPEPVDIARLSGYVPTSDTQGPSTRAPRTQRRSQPAQPAS